MSADTMGLPIEDITTSSTTIYSATDIYIFHMFPLNWSLHYNVSVYNRVMILSVIYYSTVSVMVIHRLSFSMIFMSLVMLSLLMMLSDFMMLLILMMMMMYMMYMM